MLVASRTQGVLSAVIDGEAIFPPVAMPLAISEVVVRPWRNEVYVKEFAMFFEPETFERFEQFPGRAKLPAFFWYNGAKSNPCVTTKKNVSSFVAELRAGSGFMVNSGTFRGYCRSIQPSDVAKVRQAYADSRWVNSSTFATFLPLPQD